MYAAYLPVIQVLLPRIALPFPTYNATSCYAGSFLVGPKVLCFDAQIQLRGQCEAVSSAYLIVLRTPHSPHGCKAINCFHGLITFNYVFLLLSFIAESEHYNEFLKGNLAEEGEYKTAKGSN